MITIKRIYEGPSADDGTRVLVDRLWPRGVSKEKAKLDLWLKEIAPSDELREWFNHKPERFDEFSRKYMAELVDNPAVAILRNLESKSKNVTLLYAAKDPAMNNAIILKKYLETEGR